MSDTVLELPPDTTLPPAPPAETTEAPAERQLSAREQAMMSIVENRERARALELAYGQEATTPDPEEAAAAEERATEEARRALETAAPADAPKPAVEPPKPTPAAPQTIVIDGIHFTPEQAAQLARDGLVARKAVQEFQRQQTQPRQTPPPVPQPPPRGPILAEDEAKALARDLVYGDETTNAKAIQRIVETAVSRVAPTPQVDPNAIIRAAVQQTRQAIDLQNNLATVGAEFPEIFGSPDDFTPAHNRRSQLAALALGDLRKRDAAMGVFRSDLDLSGGCTHRARRARSRPTAVSAGTGRYTRPTGSAALAAGTQACGSIAPTGRRSSRRLSTDPAVSDQFGDCRADAEGEGTGAYEIKG